MKALITTLTAGLAIVAFLLMPVVLPGCAARPIGFLSESPNGRYCDEYGDYQGITAPKVLAVAGNPDAVFVSGLAVGWADDVDLQTLEVVACHLCEARRADRQIEAPCQIHARGNCPTNGNACKVPRELSSCGSGAQVERVNCVSEHHVATAARRSK